jgi:uncharacterized protein
LSLTTEAAWLLDVNALIALIFPGHVHHLTIHAWFEMNSRAGWATGPITENGVIRIMSQPNFEGGRNDPSEVIDVLRALWRSQLKHHRFWPDQVSLTDDSIFSSQYIVGPKQVTDAYLLGLAAKRRARLVSFDRSLPWQAIRGGTAKLVQTPLLQ